LGLPSPSPPRLAAAAAEGRREETGRIRGEDGEDIERRRNGAIEKRVREKCEESKEDSEEPTTSCPWCSRSVQWPQQARKGGSSLFFPSPSPSPSPTFSPSHTFSSSSLLASPTHLLLGDLPTVGVDNGIRILRREKSYDHGLFPGGEVVTLQVHLAKVGKGKSSSL
jgi:hypothetical protein